MHLSRDSTTQQHPGLTIFADRDPEAEAEEKVEEEKAAEEEVVIAEAGFAPATGDWEAAAPAAGGDWSEAAAGATDEWAAVDKPAEASATTGW